MKKITLLLILSFLAINANAQSEAKETVKTYIEIWSMHKSSTPTIDTGDGKGSETYKTEDGKEIVFHSSMGAVNWFVSNGWKLESTHMSTCNDRTIKMYVVSKEIPVEQAKAKQQKYVKK
jgi:hypothetical protein